MKLKHTLTLLAIAAIGLTTASCSDDDEDISTSSVPTAVTSTFTKMFPNARSVEWEKNLQYYVADFNVNTFETEAWFNNNGSWAMTETDYGSLVSMLPIAVQTAFNESQYATWIVDDAKYYQRTADSFSIVEVETDGMPEIALFYDETGNIINKVQGEYFDITPTTIISDLTF